MATGGVVISGSPEVSAGDDRDTLLPCIALRVREEDSVRYSNHMDSWDIATGNTSDVLVRKIWDCSIDSQTERNSDTTSTRTVEGTRCVQPWIYSEECCLQETNLSHTVGRLHWSYLWDQSVLMGLRGSLLCLRHLCCFL